MTWGQSLAKGLAWGLQGVVGLVLLIEGTAFVTATYDFYKASKESHELDYRLEDLNADRERRAKPSPYVPDYYRNQQQQQQQPRPGRCPLEEEAERQACFTARTPLLTPSGDKFIEDFKAGDSILTRNELFPDAPVEERAVEEVFVAQGLVLNLHIGSHIIRTTAEHPFYVHRRGWVVAHKLQPGDLLISHDGCDLSPAPGSGLLHQDFGTSL